LLIYRPIEKITLASESESEIFSAIAMVVSAAIWVRHVQLATNTHAVSSDLASLVKIVMH
jgi:hypothetical protein